MKIATALDRAPSQYFKKWITHHTKFFEKKDFIFLNFSKSHSDLKKYLENEGFKDILVLDVVETKPGRDSHFEDHLVILIHQGITSKCPFIINCPIDNLAHPGRGFYRQFVGESNYVINKLKSRVLHSGHTFIFLDSDEILVGENIHSLLESDFYFIAPIAYSIVQNKEETLFDWNKPIYEQRSYWMYDELYEKPIIVKKDISWGSGRHLHHHRKENIRPEIALIHLRDVCFEYLFEENQHSKIIYPEDPKDHREAWEDREKFNEWIIKRQQNIVPIPSNFRSLFREYNI